MKHQREDYNRIQDPSGKIPENEPVFLLRAQDKFSHIVVKLWAELVDASGDHELADKAIAHANEMELWQIEHYSKTPDAPED